jgi:kynureninase
VGDPLEALTVEPEALLDDPNPLARHYGRSRVTERLLLTGHSHQAWPDCGLEGHIQAWNDAAAHLDRKWERAFAKADEVRSGFSRLLCDTDGQCALGASTHDLLVRFLSALPLARRPRIVTTDGEFHSLARQLARLEEEGIEIRRVPSRAAGDVAQRLADELDERTAAVMVSAVFFDSGRIVPDLGRLQAACEKFGTHLLIDAYHALNVVPFPLGDLGLGRSFVVGGGYKYCQLGEGNCFLRFPSDCGLRPVATGWFADFDSLAHGRPRAPVGYGPGAARFAGSTYDPTSHYRAAEVFRFFRDQGLDAPLLRQVSQSQVGLLAEGFDALDLDPRVVDRDRSVSLDALAGFLVLRSPRAGEISAGLAEKGVLTDARGDALRLGPAPYLSARQLRDAVAALGEAVREL